MHKKLEQKLVDRWPTWFDIHGDIRRTLMPWGFCHGNGWFDILWRLGEDLEPLVNEFEKETGHRFEVVQVKEKFGGLRFYVREGNNAIRQRIGAAALESLETCEVCGKPGQRRGVGWIRAFCDEHERLARIILLLAQFGKEGKPEKVIPKISQETLAEMIGTTRSRVSSLCKPKRCISGASARRRLSVLSRTLTVVVVTKF